MRSLRHISLATRLGLLFAALAVLIFSIAGSHLYQSLSRELRWHEDATLLSTIDLLRHQLEEIEETEAVRTDPHPLLDVALGHKGMLLALRDSEGNLLAASSKDYTLLPIYSPVAVNRNA